MEFDILTQKMFESLVNTEGFQTNVCDFSHEMKFESLVNTEGFQTKNLANNTNITCLRVLLIQKDFKRVKYGDNSGWSLRVLLIQKDFKPDEGLGTIGKNHIQSSSNSSSQNCSFSLL